MGGPGGAQVIMKSDPKRQLKQFKQYLQNIKRLRAATIDKYLRTVAEFLAWREVHGLTALFASLEPVALRREVEEYLGSCREHGNGNMTLRLKLTAIKSLFAGLVWGDVIISNPTSRIACLPRSPVLLRGAPLSRDEILAMFKQIDITREKGLRDAVLLILGVFAGLRLNEIISLNIDDVRNKERGKLLELHVTNFEKKSKRLVSLWEAPSKIVRSLIAARMGTGARMGDPVLVSYEKNGRPRRGNRRLTLGAADNIVKQLAGLAGIQRTTINTRLLRTTHVHDLLRCRCYDEYQVADRLGWKRLESLFAYIPKKNARNKFESLPDYWSGFQDIWSTKKDLTADGGTADRS